jgi:hypothetical protein
VKNIIIDNKGRRSGIDSATSHMPSTFLKEDHKRIAEAALIVGIGLQLKIITDRQAME